MSKAGSHISLLYAAYQWWVSLCEPHYLHISDPDPGVPSFSLSSSPSSEDGQVTVCPGTTVTFTCTAVQVGSQLWRYQNVEIGGFHSSDAKSSVIEDGPYTLTLVTVDDDDGDSLANLTSTLEVMVDDIPNRTNISCATFWNLKHLIIYRESKALLFIMLYTASFFCRCTISSTWGNGANNKLSTKQPLHHHLLGGVWGCG